MRKILLIFALLFLAACGSGTTGKTLLTWSTNDAFAPSNIDGREVTTTQPNWTITVVCGPTHNWLNLFVVALPNGATPPPTLIQCDDQAHNVTEHGVGTFGISAQDGGDGVSPTISWNIVVTEP